MKFPGPLENQRLSFLLEEAISREAQMWKVNVLKMPTNQNVSPSQRDEVIQWLAKLKYQFNLYPETFALASSLLDRFLATVKAHPKYLSCIAISCFFLAAKTVAEDERIPVLKVLARDSFCGCSSSEILRMERIILDKLNWDLHTSTPLDFLHIFHAIASLPSNYFTVWPAANFRNSKDPCLPWPWLVWKWRNSFLIGFLLQLNCFRKHRWIAPS
ncbi:cyclin-I-like isoform X2 [Balaenoptera acutorostrata]|uniref:Cyclin-I-like isoform X2 n=1 Tax=Balaenoptera acutorostrata TaxID=9767 RepID=A0ABM3UJG8_BALAC|nr:cyclin-I-like isoform X2 [Balaenoptera acutorostrata]